MQRKILISILVLIALLLSINCCYANVDDNGVDESSIMNEKYETYRDCYKDLLNLYFEKAPESEYFSVDINQDDVEEIFITTGESEAEKIMSVYTFGKDGKLVYSGYLPGGHTAFYKMDDLKQIMLVRGQMGHEEVSMIKFQNGKVVIADSDSRDLKEGESYTAGDELLVLSSTRKNVFDPDYKEKMADETVSNTSLDMGIENTTKSNELIISEHNFKGNLIIYILVFTIVGVLTVIIAKRM